MYIPSKARVPVGQLRSRLRKLDINNSRILDIHYPDRNVVALLVHNDYASELKEQLSKFKINFLDQFNPLDGKIIRDPKYASYNSKQKDTLAASLHCARMKKALEHIREPVKYTVARYFYEQKWIDHETLTSIAKTRFPTPESLFQQEDPLSTQNGDDVRMDEVASTVTSTSTRNINQ